MHHSTRGASEALDAILIWSHLKRLPFDLIYDKRIRLETDLVGEPKEMDDPTKSNVPRKDEKEKDPANDGPSSSSTSAP
ncbi:unnamed protein product [Thlaspi arvense]|uniref:Uncharacterized protein n=1 Tax=Thlaspi arvense TaxID=13288 RepID=A0AAU9T718_THLAR|nr:unnamed protein product [Thlaspi arvense]